MIILPDGEIQRKICHSFNNIKWQKNDDSIWKILRKEKVKMVKLWDREAKFILDTT